MGPFSPYRACNRGFLFVQRTGNRRGDKPYPSGTYAWMLREFSNVVQITDSQGSTAAAEPHPPVPAHQTDPARRTRPAHPRPAALRRSRDTDDGDALRRHSARNTPSRRSWPPPSSRPTAPGCSSPRDDHDSLHLFDRADRFLPNGWCLLPPLQTCDKGNALLTELTHG